MPRITTFQSQTQAGVRRLPTIRPTQDFSAAAQAGQQIARAGETLSDVAAKIQAQQDEIDASGLIGEYEGSIRGLAASTNQRTTDAQERMKFFNEDAVALQKDIAGRAKNGRVTRAFNAHVGRNYPTQRFSYNSATLDFQLRQQLASLDEQAEVFSQLAAEAATPEDRDNYINQYDLLLQKAAAGGLQDPQQIQARRQRFKEESQLAFMGVLRFRDPDKLLELEKQGAFKDVDAFKREVILDRAERERAARAAQGQVELRRALDDWRESIERETEVRIADGNLTLEWIEEFGYAMKSEKIAAYRKALRDQQLGVGTGNPEVEREMVRHVFNPKLDPRQTLARLDALYTAGQVGYEKYTPWVSHLNSEIVRRDGEARGERREGETRVRELQGRRATSYLDLAGNAFRAVGITDFDASAAEAFTQFQQEYLRRVNFYGQGNEDGGAVYTDALPRFIVQVDARIDSRLEFLKSQLGRYTTKEALKSAKGILGVAEYERLVGHLIEFQGIQLQKIRLEKTRRELEGKK